MQLHELRPKYKLKKKKRVGRGGKRGTYSGRGLKGQKSRSGRRLKPIVRELIKRYPRLKGLKFKKWNVKPVIVNIETLEEKFKKETLINPKILLGKKLISRIKGRVPIVKILGKGKITKPLVVEGCQVSKKAKDIIEKAGGVIKSNP